MNNCLRKSDLLSASAQEKIDNLPYFMRYVINTLLDCIDNIINGKCDEETIVSAMSTVQNNTNSRFNECDLLNYDEAGNMLGFGTTNRVGLKKLLDKNGIKQVSFGNTKVGFRRDEVMVLKDRLDSERKIENEKRIKRAWKKVRRYN